LNWDGAALWSPIVLDFIGMSANYGPLADKAEMSVEGSFAPF
jgi:hypothetical protein